MKDLQQNLVRQLVMATEARHAQELVATYRLAGQTAFNFHNKYDGIRLETFFQGKYYEPYYIFFINNTRRRLKQHTLPSFIPVERLARQFLSWDNDTLLRILQDLLLAFVARREEFNLLRQKTKDIAGIEFSLEDAAYTISEITVPTAEDETMLSIRLKYDSLASLQPKVTARLYAVNSGKPARYTRLSFCQDDDNPFYRDPLHLAVRKCIEIANKSPAGHR
ncbi:hypothetical protein DM01DRAFT_362166 [Hesseltinella vesiculosa]|uniref:Uncharacterized protein n=1 Tax=Hesseltinella vesiculosa TaxID=101127 RepID=A0A1X2GIS5_9FUNG|nr:hypothetical protein DM01DRAFT_362166 [Hesseltinella vesiculosa]